MAEHKFIGRTEEITMLRTWYDNPRPRITVIYGRRRVGKTSLVEEAYNTKIIWKFEGLENASENRQKENFLLTLSKLTGKREISLLSTKSWREILELLSENISRKKLILFFDEFQWLAAGKNTLVSELKYIWDNKISKNNTVHLVLCGSISSFMVKNVIRSKALYGRIDNEINLKPLSFIETMEYFGKSRSFDDILTLYLSMGGVPQYLKFVNIKKSSYLNLDNLYFNPHGYLYGDYERLFISHFGREVNYKRIINLLSEKKNLDRNSISKMLKLKSGGRLSEQLDDLSLAGFIEKYLPVNKEIVKRGSMYRLKDYYLLFYAKFVLTNKNKIEIGHGLHKCISEQQLNIWRGHALELFCYQNHSIIAKYLGFASVRYKVGPWHSTNEKGDKFQIDLAFIRADQVITICEIKNRKERLDKTVISEVRKKVEALAKVSNLTIEPVLITTVKPLETVYNEKFFNEIVILEELFKYYSNIFMLS